MTKGELTKLLEQFPDEMEVVVNMQSDYGLIKPEITIIKGVPQDGWVMRSHPTMSDENKQKVREYLLLEGGE